MNVLDLRPLTESFQTVTRTRHIAPRRLELQGAQTGPAPKAAYRPLHYGGQLNCTPVSPESLNPKSRALRVEPYTLNPTSLNPKFPVHRSQHSGSVTAARHLRSQDTLLCSIRRKSTSTIASTPHCCCYCHCYFALCDEDY